LVCAEEGGGFRSFLFFEHGKEKLTRGTCPKMGLNKKSYHFEFRVQGLIGRIFIPEVCDQHAFHPCLIGVECRAISIDGGHLPGTVEPGSEPVWLYFFWVRFEMELDCLGFFNGTSGTDALFRSAYPGGARLRRAAGPRNGTESPDYTIPENRSFSHRHYFWV